jgi:hypothetical protein
MGINHLIEITNHIVVSVSLAGRDCEGGPEVKVIVIKSGSGKVVKGYATFRDKIVHKVTSPAEARSRLADTGSSNIKLNRGNSDTKPGSKKVITSTRNIYGVLSTELTFTGGTAKDNGNLGKPGSLTGLTDEVGGSIRTTIEILF